MKPLSATAATATGSPHEERGDCAGGRQHESRHVDDGADLHAVGSDDRDRDCAATAHAASAAPAAASPTAVVDTTARAAAEPAGRIRLEQRDHGLVAERGRGSYRAFAARGALERA